MGGKETILPETPLTTTSKLVRHAIDSLKSDDKEKALHELEVVASILEKLDPYLDEVSTQGPESLNALISETIHHDWKKVYSEQKVSFPVSAHWSAGAYEGGFVAMVVKALKAKRVLEIGMFTGTTTLCVADALPADGKVVTLELDQYFKDLATPFFEKAGVKDKIDVQIGHASERLTHLKESNCEPFDVIFIDADKSGYKKYYDIIMDSNLLRKGGVLLVDNTLYKGYPFTPKLREPEHTKQLPDLGIDYSNGDALINFNKYVAEDNRVEVIILPIRDGVSWIMPK